MGEVADLGGAVDGEEIEETTEEGFAPSVYIDGHFVAPFLRIEELKDDATVEVQSGYSSGSACSSVYGTDDELALSGEASDQDGLGQPTKGTKVPDEFDVPPEELKKRIIDQVEFYFSNENIMHDAFMLKHVRRNKMGYVSLKLVTSFRKVKSLTKDYRVVAHCLQDSKLLEVNEEGTKVRRTEPLPDFDETTPSRTIVAGNLPFEKPSVEDVAELFKKFGEISLIRILRPGKSVPSDLKRHLAKHSDLANAVCAVIEFEKHESAKAASEQINGGSEEIQKGMKVNLLAPPKKEKGGKGEKKVTKEAQQTNSGKKTKKKKVPTATLR